MVEFKAELYPLSDDVCCYCDKEIPDQEPRAKFDPCNSGSGSGVFVMIVLTFCESCLKDIAERCGDVSETIQRHRQMIQQSENVA